MIKIVDAGCLRDEKVEAYLNNDVNNLLAFTDYSCMEALKGGTLYNIKKSLKVVSEYSNQIVILKSSSEIMRVDYNLMDFRKAFIDEKQTLSFPEFCIEVSRADNSDAEFTKDLLERSRDATKFLESLASSAVLLLQAITSYNQELDKEFLKYIRTDEKWTINEYQYACTQVFELYKTSFRKNIFETQSPEIENFLDHFLFRHSLSNFLLVLKWLIDHGWKSYPAENMRNDGVDMFYVTFATYYDGVLSNDKKVTSIYQQAIGFIEFLENNSPDTDGSIYGEKS